MAAKSAQARAGKARKGVKGKMPSKRSINLVLVDENKISVLKAVPGILIIVVLAAVFSKFLVADRLIAVSQAAAKVTRLQSSLDEAMELVNSFGDVEDTYAHYTLEGMTQAELGLVDRTQVLDLVGTILPEPKAEAEELAEALLRLLRPRPAGIDAATTHQIKTWSVSENLLTIELSGRSLETLNLLARQLEQSPIVDSCTITTANKDLRNQTDDEVWARIIVYLQQPPEEVDAP